MLVLMLGVFMTALDSFVFAPALPSIVGDLKTSLDMVTWTMTVYMLFYAALMPLSGKLSDTFGRKRVYIAGVALFTLGSLLSSLSWDVYSMIAFRVVQAIGSSLVLPSALATMMSASSKDQQGKTVSVLMAMVSVAMVIGPNLGGYLIQHFGWRTVFYINIPIGILIVLLAMKFKESYGETKQHIDIVGSVLLAGSLAALLLGLVRLETLPFSDVTVFPLIVAAALLAIVLVIYEKRTPGPILDIPLLSRGNVLSLLLAWLLTSASLILAVVYVPSFAQVVLRMNVQDSGSILTPLSVALMISAVIGGILIDKFGTRPLLFISSLTTAIVLFGLAMYVNDSTSLAIVLALLGVTMGLGMGAFQIIMMAWMPESEKATGSGILGTFKSLGGVVGSVIGSIFLADATRGVVTIGHAFSNVFWTGAIIAALATVMIVYLIIRDRRKVEAPAPMPQQ